ncbi:hypothetical protein CRE_09061 [Caenorhabditis remanei]|uniref:Uncharacterized protein n=1 Tax=Caenorhabditis remanei TaxID=31234 RepID=E3LJ50_CAERE|nr:hypothetical protein CRE_09061 [Caenorhabditis remanei]
MASYDSDGRIKIESLQNITVDLFLVCSHYLAIIYCGIKMHFNMKRSEKVLGSTEKASEAVLQRSYTESWSHYFSGSASCTGSVDPSY